MRITQNVQKGENAPQRAGPERAKTGGVAGVGAETRVSGRVGRVGKERCRLAGKLYPKRLQALVLNSPKYQLWEFRLISQFVQ